MRGNEDRRGRLESRVDGFAFECEDAEHAFMDLAKRFATYEAFERLDALGRLAQGQGSFAAEAAILEPE